MWMRLPLSLKLIVPLVVMQIIVMGLGVTWLSSYLESSRMRELSELLDSQTDAIEDAASAESGKIHFDLKSELVRELFRDPNYYFALVAPDGEILDQSVGPSSDLRRQFKEQFPLPKDSNEKITRITVHGGPWLASDESFGVKALDGIHLYTAVNAGPAIKELKFIRHALVIGAVLFCFLTSFGTALIVSHTTANLKAFSQSLAAINPQKLNWSFSSQPRSAEERLLFSSFQTMISAIRQASATQRVFIANASHELKTPVSALLMALEVMLSKPRKVEEYEATGRDMLQSARGLKRLSGLLLDIARLDHFSTVAMQSVSIDSIFERLRERWLKIADAKSITLQFFDEAPDAEWMSNPELLDVALGNFIDNAIKYSPDSTKVSVSAKGLDSNHRIEIQIRDEGIGMNEDHLAKLGEVFFRVDDSRTDQMSYGLGFAQSKRIIQLLGGQILVESALGKGTMITLSFLV